MGIFFPLLSYRLLAWNNPFLSMTTLPLCPGTHAFSFLQLPLLSNFVFFIMFVSVFHLFSQYPHPHYPLLFNLKTFLGSQHSRKMIQIWQRLKPSCVCFSSPFSLTLYNIIQCSGALLKNYFPVYNLVPFLFFSTSFQNLMPLLLILE